MSDPFSAVTGLIALLTDVKACAKRLSELQAAIDASEKAQTHLAADRETHARTGGSCRRAEELFMSVSSGSARRASYSEGSQELAAARRELAPRCGFDPKFGPGCAFQAIVITNSRGS